MTKIHVRLALGSLVLIGSSIVGTAAASASSRAVSESTGVTCTAPETGSKGPAGPIGATGATGPERRMSTTTRPTTRAPMAEPMSTCMGTTVRRGCYRVNLSARGPAPADGGGADRLLGDTLGGMCRKVTCRQCGKAGWAGCGAHVEQVLRGVPLADRCSCGSGDSSSTRPAPTAGAGAPKRGLLSRLRGQ